jgi:ABC-type multidrug transport system ATPase subunit
VSTALEFRGVVKHYGRLRALDGLELRVPSGSIFGLVGSNGAGKTTAMAVAVGLLRPDGGDIQLLEAGPFDSRSHAGRVTLLPQDSRFPPHARVEELLRFYGRLQGVAVSALGPMIDELLEWVHLGDRRRSAVRTLSHGMNRRLAIAQAFVGAPELILLDEPLNGLDPREAARVRDLIRQRRGRQAIVISSHNLADLEALCDHVAFVEKGRLVRQDTLDKIMRRGQRLTYVLGGGVFPLARLSAELPAVVWDQQDHLVTATFTEPHTPESLNAVVLRALLDAGVGILEIQRGSNLESEYLRLAGAPPVLAPAGQGSGEVKPLTSN